MINSSVKAPVRSSLRNALTHFSPRKLSRRFHQDESGIAAIEFAVIAPIMIGMYFGLAEIASAISVDRRVSHATNVAGDLATQMTELNNNEIEEVVSAALRVLDVPNISDVSMSMESFILPAEGQAPESEGSFLVNTGRGANTFAPFDASTLDSQLLSSTSGIVVTRIRYRYTPLQLSFFDSTLTLEETFLLKPRRSDSLKIQNGAGAVVGCTATHYSEVNCG